MALIVEPLIWVIYHIIIVTAIAIDLKISFKRDEITLGEATKWLLLWIGIGLAFGAFILFRFGFEPALLYYTTYVVEYTLSMDNLFVFAVIFIYFAVPLRSQRSLLYIGIIAAMIMRGGFLYGGILLLETFSWVVFIFGITLIYLGIKIWKGGAKRIEPEKNPVIVWAKKFLPLTDKYHGSKLMIKQSEKFIFTPLILVFLSITVTDFIFAFDSLPAAIALTRDFFLAYTSNISAILGLRSLYFVITKSMFGFKYVSKGLALILIFLGLKFFLAEIGLVISTLISITFIFTVLAGSILLSIKKRD